MYLTLKVLSKSVEESTARNSIMETDVGEKDTLEEAYKSQVESTSQRRQMESHERLYSTREACIPPRSANER